MTIWYVFTLLDQHQILKYKNLRIQSIFQHFTAVTKLLFSIPLHEYFKTPRLKDLYRCLVKEGELGKHFIKKSSQMSLPLTSKCVAQRITKEAKIPHEEILQ